MHEIIISLTNRSTGFFAPGLDIPDTVLQKQKPSAEADEVRSLLKLNQNDHPYYLKGILAAIFAYPEVHEGFDEKVRSYDISKTTRQPVTFIKGFLGSDRNGPPTVLVNPEKWPVFFSLSLKYKQDGYGQLEGGNTSEAIPVRKLNDGGLEVEWPTWSGVSGKVWPDSPFGPGFEFGIMFEPVSYPYKLVAELLRSSSANRKLVQKAGLTVPFFYAETAMEQVAVSALALGLNNATVYTDA